jgi:predicted anti-sigma-YlaC factor YlaD
MQRHLTDSAIERLVDSTPEALDEEQQAHLAQCGTCRDEVKLAQAIALTLGSVPLTQAPPELFQGVIEAVAKAPRPRQALWHMGFFALGALVLLLLWLGAGGAGPWALETVTALRSLAFVGRLAGSLGSSLPLEIVILCTVIMVGGCAALRQLVLRASPEHQAVEAG